MIDRAEPVATTETPLPPVLAVGGVVYRKRRKTYEVVLIKKRGGFWTLPKGHVECGESHLDAVVRELREETGLQCRVRVRLSAASYTVIKNGVSRTKIVTYYLLRAKPGQLRPDKREGIVRIKWFSIDEALRRIRLARVRGVVQQARAVLTTGEVHQ